MIQDMQYNLTSPFQTEGDVIFIFGDEVPSKGLSMLKKDEIAYLQQRREQDVEALVVLTHIAAGKTQKIYVQNFDSALPANEAHEKLRRAAAVIQEQLTKDKTRHIGLTGESVIPEEMMAFLEGLVLSNYRFDKYKTKKDVLLETIDLDGRFFNQEELERNKILWNHVFQCREWVNEPVMYFNAETFANRIEEEAKRLGVKATIMGQKKIESLKMGGLLAVNRGSVDEARFVVLDYNPADAINAKPVALVGKGITYDTGGLNIKPDEHMREMKSDMAGAATMASALFAAAENKLPIHLMAFLPMTDNRPCGNAYAADDVLTMYDGTTVEVVNTDAEGRIILADAIAYSNQYDPELIIDCATLTGAAVRAIGTIGIAAMHQNAENPMSLLKIVGNHQYERIAELPFWKEYDEMIHSEIADIKNCGIGQAGAITAGKFLAHFAKHPYVHLDIAGVAYYPTKESFYGVGGSGFGVRLLYAFFQTYDMMNGETK